MAANAQGIRAGRAFVEVGLDDKLTAGLKKMRDNLMSFAKGIRAVGLATAGAGTAIGAPLLAVTKAFASSGDKLDELSASTGVSVEALSELGYVADVSGASLEDLRVSLKHMQVALVKAKEGSQEQIDALALMGIEYKKLDAIGPEKQFELIASGIDSIKDPAQRAAAAVAIFGRNGTALIPMMTGGAEGISRLREEAKRLGITMSSESARSAGILNDQLDTLWKVIGRAGDRIGAALTPALISLAQWSTEVAASVGAWLEKNQRLIVEVGIISAALVGLGGTLIALGYGVSIISKIVGAILSMASTASSAVGAVGGLMAAMSGPQLLAAGAAIGAVGFAVYQLIQYFGGAGEAAQWFADQFSSIRDLAGTVMSGVGDAVAAGDLQLAFEIAWAGIELGWVQILDKLKTAYAAFVKSIKPEFNLLKADAESVALNAMSKYAKKLDDGKMLMSMEQKSYALADARKKGLSPEETQRAIDSAGSGLWYEKLFPGLAGKDNIISDLADDKVIEGAKKLVYDEADQKNKQIAKEREPEDRADREAAEKRQKDIQDRVDALRRLRERAAEQAAEAAANRASTPRPNRSFSFPEELIDSAAMKRAHLSSVSTFNPAAVFGLGGQSPITQAAQAAARAANAAEKMHKQQERLLQILQSRTLVFS